MFTATWITFTKQVILFGKLSTFRKKKNQIHEYKAQIKGLGISTSKVLCDDGFLAFYSSSYYGAN